MGFTSSLFYMIGCVLLVPAGFYLKIKEHYEISINIYIIGCGFLLLASIIDLVPAISTRPKVTPDGENLLSEELEKKQTNWLKSLFICIFYFLGGLFFELGSLLDHPSFLHANEATWVFRTGSCCYLAGSFMSLHSVWGPYFRKEKDTVDCYMIMYTCLLVFYIIGSCLYITGGILFQTKSDGGVETWIAGGFSFLVKNLLLTENHSTMKKEF